MLIAFIALTIQALFINGITISFLLVGVCCSYQVIAIYKVSTYSSKRVAGLTTAVANMIIMVFGYFFYTAIGLVVKFYGGIESSSDLVYGINIITIALVIAIIGFLIILYQDKVIRTK